MKMKYKLQNYVVLILILSFFAPALSFAETAEQGENAFCAKLSSFVEKANLEIAEQLKNSKSGRVKKLSDVTDEEEKQNRSIKTQRTEEDSQSLLFLKGIESKAVTEVQKKAVLEFGAQVKILSSVRRQQTDIALANYRSGIRRLLENYNANVTEITKSFQSAVSSAALRAEASCSSGIKPQVVRKDFKNTLAVARDTVRDNKKVLQKSAVRFQQLLSDQNSALKKAEQNYKTGLQKAKETLKQVF